MFWTTLRRLAGGLFLALVALSLLSPAAGAATAPKVTASPGEEAGHFRFVATGFGRSETLHYYLLGPGGQSIGGRDHTTDGDGELAFGVKLPRWAAAGVWTIVVEEEDSDRRATATFDRPALGPDIALTLDYAEEGEGTLVIIRADAFDAKEEVRYWLTGPDGKVYLSGTVEASVRGHIYVEALVAAGQPAGTWTVSAYGQESDHLGVASFER